MKKKQTITYGIIIILTLISIVGIALGCQDVIRVLFHKEHLMGTVAESRLYRDDSFSDFLYNNAPSKQYLKVQLDKAYGDTTTTLEIWVKNDQHSYDTGDKVMVVFNNEDYPKPVSVVWLWYGIVGFAALIIAIIMTVVVFSMSDNTKLPPGILLISF